jgi:hypothetical protein
MKRLHRFLRVPVLLSPLLACQVDGPVTLVPVSAVVYGTVVAVSGQAVPGVRIEMRLDPEGRCPALEQTNVNVGTIETMTDEEGAFRTEVLHAISLDDPLEATCVRLVVSPPLPAGLRDTAISVGPVRFTRFVTDSVRAEIVLQAR